MNGQYCRDALLMRGLLPEMRSYSEYFMFQHDGAPAHRAPWVSVDLLKQETPDFIPQLLRPPNSQDINPVDYAVWGILQDCVHRNQIQDVEELCQHITEEWDSCDQRVIDSAIREWHERLQAGVVAEGGHFEHEL